MNNISLLIENNRRPLNETETHYLLKQIGKYLLRKDGCKIIGTEIDIGYDNKTPIYKDIPDFFKVTRKRVTDVIGIKCSNSNWRKDSKTIIIESKASLSDYKNGFCTYADITYVIAPLGIIPIDKIPKEIGFIEVDLDNYNPISGSDFDCIHYRQRPKNRSKVIKSDLHYYEDILYSIANRFSNDDIFNQCQIKLTDIDDLSVEQLSKKLGYKEGTLISDIERAKKQLKRLKKVK